VGELPRSCARAGTLVPAVLFVGLGISHFAYRWAQFWIVAWQLG
jgi:hypothetical protein